MTRMTSGDSPLTKERIADKPTWLIQYSPHSARSLQRAWDEGWNVESPAVDRNVADMQLEDIVLFWVSGPTNQAGVIGFGLASGIVEDHEHPKSYRHPDGPKALRATTNVWLCNVFAEPVITRDELKMLSEFDNFDLFKMPNRSNAFIVSGEQWAIILNRLEEVVGR